MTGFIRIHYDTIYISVPIANFTGSPSFGCGPLSVNFTNQSTGSFPFTSWNWNFGNGNSSSGQNPTNIYNNSGTYSVSLFATDSIGCTATVSKTNYVQTIGPNVNFGYDNPISCINKSINFTDNTVFSSPPISWTWNFGDGTPTSSLQNPSHTYTGNGVFIVSLTVRDLDGCSRTKIDSVTIANNNVTANFSMPDSNFCNTVNLMPFTDLSVNANKWFWDFSGASTSTAQNPVRTFPINTGINKVVLIVTDTVTGCTDSSFKYTYLSDFTFNFTLHSPLIGCSPYSVEFEHNSTSVFPLTNEVWDLGDGNTSPLAYQNHTYTDRGLFSTKLTLTDSIGCKDSTTYVVFAVADPLADFSMDDTTVCPNQTVSFTDNSFGGYNPSTATIISWNWNFGDGNTSTTQNPTHSYVNPGKYYITLTVANDSCSNNYTDSILVLDITANFIATDSITCSPSTVSFSNTSVTTNGTISNYLWRFGDGTTSQLQNPNHTYFNFNDSVTLIAFDTINGCLDSVKKLTQVFLSYTDTVYDTICENESYILPGGNVTNIANIYVDTLISINGCDSIISTYLHVSPVNLTLIDTSICQGDSIFVMGNYQKSSGTYYDSLVNIYGCDSIIQTNLVINPPFNTSQTITICNNDSIFLENEWRKTPGVYYDSLTTELGCDSIVTTTLLIKNQSTSKVYDTICEGDNIFLQGTYQSLAGNYFDTLINFNGCDSIVETQLFISPNPLFSYTDDTLITIGDQITLVVSAGYSYSWSPSTWLSCNNCNSPIAIPETTITYQLTVSDGKCDTSVNINVNVQENAEIFVPNVFSPNGDNSNDIFKIRGAIFSEYRMIIFDRWGEKMYETNNFTEGWDGKFRGKDAIKGAYTYIIEGVTQKGEEFMKNGSITIIR